MIARIERDVLPAHKQGEPMDSLDQKLVEAREREFDNFNHVTVTHPVSYFVDGFDAAAAIAREVVAEKDKRIQELEALVLSSQPTCSCPNCNCATKLGDICDYCHYNHILYGPAPRMDKML